MELVKLILILSTSLLLSHAAKNPCPPQYCGTNPLPIRFPFTLHQHPGNCTGYPGLTFTCSVDEGRDVPLLQLPHSGSFSVRHINYLMQEIHLYDPAGCLPRRLISLNLTSSPFAAALTEELTFLSCPRRVGLAEVECLGNATSAVLAGPAGRLSGAMAVCGTMFTVPIAVPWDGGDWVAEDLRLTWSLPECQGCEVGGGVCGLGRSRSGVVGEITCFSNHGTGRGLEVFKTIALSIVIPAIICSICISCFVCIVEWKAVRSRAAAVAAPSLQPPAMVGLDDSTIESYEKVVLGESKRLPGPNGVTCPICLVDYCPKDILRCIPECQHCFHSECVDEWLRLNSSCPLCRNSPSNSLEQV
ncbi:putative RING-H2 finger protein ATL21A [Salvia splendens]|uniref:putative RING-H2 finger protein ATL21A n=1 Tax=Salvia splendens TaxID=180675 RepID=UPI001C26D386|nr:putative RING-H2 finger protein ATL21A [Salvia splendens]